MAQFFSDDELRALSASREMKEMQQENEILRRERAKAKSLQELDDFITDCWPMISDALKSYSAVAESCGKRAGRLPLPKRRFRSQRLSSPLYHLHEGGDMLKGKDVTLFVSVEGVLMGAQKPIPEAKCYDIDPVDLGTFMEMCTTGYSSQSERVSISKSKTFFTHCILRCLLDDRYLEEIFFGNACLVNSFTLRDSESTTAALKVYMVELAMQPWYGFSG